MAQLVYRRDDDTGIAYLDLRVDGVQYDICRMRYDENPILSYNYSKNTIGNIFIYGVVESSKGYCLFIRHYTNNLFIIKTFKGDKYQVMKSLKWHGKRMEPLNALEAVCEECGLSKMETEGNYPIGTGGELLSSRDKSFVLAPLEFYMLMTASMCLGVLLALFVVESTV